MYVVQLHDLQVHGGQSWEALVCAMFGSHYDQQKFSSSLSFLPHLSANSALRRDLPTMLQRLIFIDSAKILHNGSTHSRITNHQLLCSLISTSGFGVSLPTIILVLLREYHCQCAIWTRRFYCHCKDLLWITSYEMCLSKSATPGGAHCRASTPISC